MALDKQIFNISFNKGLDTKSDDKQIVPGKLLTLENVVLKKTGKFIKRNGYGVIANNGGISNGNALATFKNELLAMDGSTISSYSSSDDKLYSKGTKVAVDLSVQSVARNSYEQSNPDSAYHSAGLSIYAWEDSSGGVRYAVFDITTKLAIVSNGLVSATGSKPKVKSIGSNILIFYIDGSDLKYFKINSASPSTTYSATTLANDCFNWYDVSYFNSQIYVAYATGLTTCIFSISSALAQSAITTVSEVSSCLCVFGDTSNNVWVTYNSGNDLKYFIRDSAITGVVLAPTTIESGSAPFVNVAGIYDGTGKIWYEVTGDISSNQYVKYNTASVSGSVGTSSVFMRSVGLFSKPFIYGSSVYITVTHDSALQPTYFVVNGSSQVVLKLAPSLGGGLSTNGMLAEVNAVSSGVYLMAYEFKDFVQSVNGDVTTQTGVNACNITFSGQIVTSEIANNLNASGGIVSMYDGQSVVEKGFNLYPEGIINLTNPISVGGSIGSGSYQYSQVYEWTDSQGQLHRSAPSVPTTIEFTNNDIYVVGNASGNNTNVFYVEYTQENANTICKDLIVQGAGLPANTYIDQVNQFNSTLFQIVLTQNSTSSAGTDYVLTISQNVLVRGNVTTGSKQIHMVNQDRSSYFGKCTAGSPTITLGDVTGLFIGSNLRFSVGYVGVTLNGTVKITAINGNDVTLGTNNATVSYDNACFIFENATTATFTNGSPTLTSVQYPDMFIEGNVVSLTGFSGSAYPTVISVSGSDVTLSANYAGATVTTTAVPGISPKRKLGVGQVFTEYIKLPQTTAAFPALTIVQSFDDNYITASNYSNQELTANGGVGGVYLFISASSSTLLKLPMLRITDKSDVSLALYRTVSNGTVFYRVTSFTAPISNDKTIDYVSYYDGTNDSNIIGNEQLYTTGGEVENISPPASSIIGTYKNRLIVVPNEDTLAFWYSKQVRANTPVEFNDSFIQRVPEKGGDITAFQQMDDKMIIFKQDYVFVMVGDGPSVSGVNNDFTDPQLITADCGCSDKKSVIVLPTGLIFKSQKGFYLLDRALNVKYIGADVEGYNSQSVNSAKMIETENQVRFNMSGGDTIVFDYYLEQWDTFKGISAVDSASFQDRYTYLLSNGQIRRETPGTYLDNTSFIPVKLETGWLNLAGLQGFQRIYYFLIIGNYKSPHTLQIDLYRDFIETPYETVTIPVLSAPTKYQYRVFPSIQKCESIKIKITELQSSPYGEGFDISGIAIEVGVKRGPNRVSPDESFG